MLLNMDCFSSSENEDHGFSFDMNIHGLFSQGINVFTSLFYTLEGNFVLKVVNGLQFLTFLLVIQTTGNV